ncbi:hypothetical protein Scep_010817 [Stephania cephalantha]|uniref:Uncharacterized protein n=1 Tax=Stephania cephalantha TaxID=152367 RepID=A0AAP0JW30_9MAGN
MSMIIRPPPPPPFIIDTPKEQPQHDDDNDDDESLEELMKRVERVKEMMKGGEYVDKFLMRNVVGEEEEVVVVMRGHVEVMVGDVVERFWEKPVEYLRSGGGRLEDRVKDLRRIVGIFEQACLDHGKEVGSSKRGKQCPFLQKQSSSPTCGVDLCEEYVNAFRTESYNEFWTRVLAFTQGNSATCSPSGSTTAARLNSYRLFAEQLLEPDQQTVAKALASSLPENRSKNRSLLIDYFSNTADASHLCGLLLKDIDQTRRQYRPLKTIIDSFKTTMIPPKNHFPSFPIPSTLEDSETSNSPSKQFGSTSIVDSLKTTITQSEKRFRITINDLDFSNCSTNPFSSSASAQVRFRSVQAECRALLDRLELRREKARTRLRFVDRFKHGSAIILIIVTASVVVIVTTHALAMLVAMPSLLAASIFKKVSSSRLARESTQMDAAVRGTYILNRDLDTISRLVARLDDELEHIRDTVRFWVEHEEGRFKPDSELARQLQKNELSFREQLDELEEHLYLCFMTINRARSLVMKEILEGVQV